MKPILEPFNVENDGSFDLPIDLPVDPPDDPPVDPPIDPNIITVTWNTDGGTPAPTQTTVNHGGSITAPAAMTKADHIFQGWYSDSGFTTKATFSITNVTAATTLWARWSHTENGPYRVGDRGPGGGIIFYVADGQGNNPIPFALQGFVNQSGSPYMAKYLEAAPANVAGTPAWAERQSDNVTETEEGIGTGRRNTALIIAHGAANTYSTPAASATQATIGGYSDWFLPSKDELNQLCLRRADIGIPSSNYYWSSTQYSPTQAWNQNFNNGTSGVNFKDNSYLVRPIRAFGDGPATPAPTPP